MTPATARQHMNEIQASQRPQLPLLMRKLALAYALPLGLALLLATIGALLLSQVIPSSTATAIVFSLNVAVFYYGWNAMEKRTRATALFSLYVTGSRERRTLASMIQTAEAGNTRAASELEQQVGRYAEIAQRFIAGFASSN